MTTMTQPLSFVTDGIETWQPLSFEIDTVEMKQPLSFKMDGVGRDKAASLV